MDEWQFEDPPNTTCVTTTFVLEGSPILRVYHDYDGGWQLLGSADEPATEDVARIVSFGSMVARDASVVEVNDLPHGWVARRDSIDCPWVRERNHPFPTYGENGYYLEDAVWVAQFRDDVLPPAEKVRVSLPVGTYVKLLFRFAAEDAERADNQTERMWVLITGFDEDEQFIGTLENDPVHVKTVEYGDVVRFHPVHIMEILGHENTDSAVD